MFENPRRGRQARNFTTNAPKILDLKSSSEQIFSRKLPLGALDCTLNMSKSWANHKARTFTRHFPRYSHKINLLALLGQFTDRNDRFLYPFTSEIPKLSYTWSMKQVTLRAKPSRKVIIGSSPPPSPPPPPHPRAAMRNKLRWKSYRYSHSNQNDW